MTCRFISNKNKQNGSLNKAYIYNNDNVYKTKY